MRYGSCLEAFLSAPEVLPGRFTCGSVDDERDAQDLLMPAGPRPSLLNEAQAAGLGGPPLAGLRRTVLGDTAVLFGLVESRSRVPPRLLPVGGHSSQGRHVRGHRPGW